MKRLNHGDYACLLVSHYAVKNALVLNPVVDLQEERPPPPLSPVSLQIRLSRPKFS